METRKFEGDNLTFSNRDDFKEAPNTHFIYNATKSRLQMLDSSSGYPKVFFWVVNLKDSPTGVFPYPVKRCWAGRAGLQFASLTTWNKTSSLLDT